MKIGMSRKINLQKYGGNQYESVDFWIEDETMLTTELEECLTNWIEDYIKHLPEEQAKFDKAKSEQPLPPPFAIVSPEQQKRHEDKLK